MGWLGKVIGGGLGFLCGGPLGAAIGAAAGHYGIDGGDGPSAEEQHQLEFMLTVLVSMSKMATVDGFVNQQERQYMDDFIRNELKLQGDARQAAQSIAFGSASDDISPYECFAKFGAIVGYDIEMSNAFLMLLHGLACVDGDIRDGELELLRLTENALRLHPGTVDQLIGSSQSDNSNLDEFYKILSCDSNAEDDDVRAAYRSCCRKYHPDYLESKELPEEFIAFANNQMAKISEAYNAIMEYRSSAKSRATEFGSSFSSNQGDSFSELILGFNQKRYAQCYEDAKKRLENGWQFREIALLSSLKLIACVNSSSKLDLLEKEFEENIHCHAYKTTYSGKSSIESISRYAIHSTMTFLVNKVGDSVIAPRLSSPGSCIISPSQYHEAYLERLFTYMRILDCLCDIRQQTNLSMTILLLGPLVQNIGSASREYRFNSQACDIARTHIESCDNGKFLNKVSKEHYRLQFWTEDLEISGEYPMNCFKTRKIKYKVL